MNMKAVPGQRDQFIAQVAAQIRPLLLLTEPDKRIAYLVVSMIDDALIRSMDQTCRELVRAATSAINGKKRAMARAVVEGQAP